MQSILLTVALVGVIGLVGSVILVTASKALAVQEDERLGDVVAILPGLNCGSCGYPGCEGYAKAMLAGAPCNSCTPGGARVAGQLASYLGVDAGEMVVRKAIVACHGARDRLITVEKDQYLGVDSCRVFSTMSHLTTACNNGCLGFGDCVATCPFGALSLNENGVAEVDQDVCTGCGMCAAICPRHLISVVEHGQTDHPSFVLCRNTMTGKMARTACANVCLGCRKCAKACPQQCITVENNVAMIDASRCVGCGTCLEVCPSKAINPMSIPQPKTA